MIKNRWFVVIGAILVQLALGSLYSWGSMTIFLSPVLGLPREVTVYIFGVSIISFAFTMILAGDLMKKIGPQKTAILGAIVMGIGAFLSAFFIMLKSSLGYGVLGILVPFIGLIIGYGFLYGAGIGLSYVVPIATANKWFPDKKGFITGVAVAGFGAGSFVFNYVIKFLANPQGLQSNDSKFPAEMAKTVPIMFVVLGIIYLIAIIIGSKTLQNPPDGWVPEGWTPSAPKQGSLVSSRNYERKELVRMRQSYLLMFAFLLSAMCGLIVIGSFAAFATSTDSRGDYIYAIGTVDFVLVASLAALFNGAGRIVWGKIADSIGFKMTMMIMFVIQAILMFLYFTTNVNWVFFLLMTCLIFFCFGGNLALFPTGTSDLFGSKNLGKNYGFIFIGYGVAGFIGAVGVSLFVMTFGSYLFVFLFLGFLSLGAAALVFLIQPPTETKTE
jgi:OFA family oxalate/formate antiporter-like MFS transporter